MRWDKKTLINVTGKKTATAQARWFRTVLGANVPTDSLGVVMNNSVYDALVRNSCGLPYAEFADQFLTKSNPQVRI